MKRFTKLKAKWMEIVPIWTNFGELPEFQGQRQNPKNYHGEEGLPTKEQDQNDSILLNSNPSKILGQMLETRNPYPAKLSVKCEIKIKTFSDTWRILMLPP